MIRLVQVSQSTQGHCGFPPEVSKVPLPSVLHVDSKGLSLFVFDFKNFP